MTYNASTKHMCIWREKNDICGYDYSYFQFENLLEFSTTQKRHFHLTGKQFKSLRVHFSKAELELLKEYQVPVIIYNLEYYY